jgi:hypothetical protein
MRAGEIAQLLQNYSSERSTECSVTKYRSRR